MTRRKIRVLIVDNNATARMDYAALVRDWEYEPVVVEDDGTGLAARAKALAHERRCPIALVDMRLVEDADSGDESGLELIRALPYTRSIVITAYDTTDKARRALNEYKAASFIGKGEDPAVLRAELDRLALDLRLTGEAPRVVWADGLSSAAVRDEMFPGQPAIPDDEAETLIRQLFKDKASVRLTRITADGATPSPDSDTPSAGTSLRRESRVFVAKIAGEGALQVVKLARTDKIEREQRHFREFVQGGIPSVRRPELTGTALLWDMGAIAYRMVSFAHLAEGTSQIFTRVYRSTPDVGAIIAPLRDFFAYTAWGNWYRGPQVRELEGTLVEAYDENFRHALSRGFAAWRAQAKARRFGALPVELPNPTRWLAEHHRRCADLRGLRQVITHGDLHGDNLYVDDRHAWPIDFERTGYGPLLRDFVELVQDLTTRIADLRAGDLHLVYELAVALCAPHDPRTPIRPTRAILAHPEAHKLFLVVQALQDLAAERAAYDDRREYLWGLLCNHLFVATKLQGEGPRWLRTMVFAAVICARLERWGERPWPPPGWTPVEWADAPPPPLAGGADPLVAPAGAFAHGYALLVGVGAVPCHPELREPVTVNDAHAVQAVLTDPSRCGYAPRHVRLLHDEGASREGILGGLRWLAEAAREDANATVVVYYSGHGLRDANGRFALIPSDADLGRPDATLLWDAALSDAIRAIPTRRLLVCVDACHAQAMTAKDGLAPLGAGLSASAPPARLLNTLAQDQGRAVLSACHGHERSYYLAGEGLSLFTRYLVEALTGAASRPGETEVTLSDLQHHLSAEVPRAARLALGVEQHPWYELSGVDWPVALLLGGKEGGK